MIEQPQGPTGSDAEPEEAETGVASDSLADNVSFARPDVDLEGLVDVANRVGLGMSLTLVTSGGVVSGKLISYSQFWNETADLFQRMSIADERAAAGAKALADAFRERASEGLSGNDDEDTKAWPPRYIHLKDTWIHDGQKYINVGLWRGRLAMVVGWSFGESS